MKRTILLIEDNEQKRHLPAFLLETQGGAVARELRNSPVLHNIPIVAITSYAMTSDTEKTIAAGCDESIEKPINPDAFPAEIESYTKDAQEESLS